MRYCQLLVLITTFLVTWFMGMLTILDWQFPTYMTPKASYICLPCSNLELLLALQGNSFGNLMRHSRLVSLPGKVLTKQFSTWAILCTKSWLTHTWQYALENGWEIVTRLPSLLPKCENDQFLMELFWLKGYHAQQLINLNHCQLWLQVTSLARIVDGQGTHLLPSILSGIKSHSSPSLHWWPKQAPPTQAQWTLWQTALYASLLTNDLLKLVSSLGTWTTSPDSWTWFWSDTDEHLWVWMTRSLLVGMDTNIMHPFIWTMLSSNRSGDQFQIANSKIGPSWDSSAPSNFSWC